VRAYVVAVGMSCSSCAGKMTGGQVREDSEGRDGALGLCVNQSVVTVAWAAQVRAKLDVPGFLAPSHGLLAHSCSSDSKRRPLKSPSSSTTDPLLLNPSALLLWPLQAVNYQSSCYLHFGGHPHFPATRHFLYLVDWTDLNGVFRLNRTQSFQPGNRNLCVVD
jgi:hypothetical protein